MRAGRAENDGNTLWGWKHWQTPLFFVFFFVVLFFHQAGAVEAGANLSISINPAITEIPALLNPRDHA